MNGETELVRIARIGDTWPRTRSPDRKFLPPPYLVYHRFVCGLPNGESRQVCMARRRHR